MLESTHHLIEEASSLTYELFASPKSIAYATRRQQELLTADTIPYIPGKSLADLFR
jgi:hypothetical protein